MNKETLVSTIKSLLTKGKGILAADETPANIGKKFSTLHIENTPQNRQRYRDMLFSALHIEDYISGVIMQDETIHQRTKENIDFPELLKNKAILTGIKVDLGLQPFNQDSIETVTKGLDGLGERLQAYKACSASFAKWRSVIHIDPKNGKPSKEAMLANVEGLAEYAYICQQEGVVPIVEPEVLMDGAHGIEQSYEVTAAILEYLFKALDDRGVYIEGMLLKPNMVIPGLMCVNQVSPEIVAEKTLECFKNTLPSTLPGIVFLSGGQRDELAIKHLALMNQSENLPWVLSFSYGRALQRQALTLWKGQDENVPAAQAAFIEQARLNSLATLGQLVN